MTENGCTPEPHPDWPFGYGRCHCGCGSETALAKRSNFKHRGTVKGKPQRFVQGHQNRVPREFDFVEEDRGFETPCLIWQGRIGPDNGYGYTGDGELIHRRSYREHHGSIPGKCQVHHRCEVRACGNADHLEAVTSAINSQLSGSAKLNQEKVAEIRALIAEGRTNRSIADQFGVGHQAISLIRRGKSWREPILCPNCNHIFEPYD